MLSKELLDPLGLRANYELAQTMLELLEQTKVSTEPEIE